VKDTRDRGKRPRGGSDRARSRVGLEGYMTWIRGSGSLYLGFVAGGDGSTFKVPVGEAWEREWREYSERPGGEYRYPGELEMRMSVCGEGTAGAPAGAPREVTLVLGNVRVAVASVLVTVKGEVVKWRRSRSVARAQNALFGR
jgi:hypothetical protein